MKSSSLILASAALMSPTPVGFQSKSALANRKVKSEMSTHATQLFSSLSENMKKEQMQTKSVIAGPSTYKGKLSHYQLNPAGADATNLADFAKAWKGTCEVKGNKHANDPSKFQQGLFVFGEFHHEPQIPSIFGGSGTIMFEATDPEFCIDQYYSNPENKCLSLEGKSNLSAEQAATKKVNDKFTELLNLIHPKALERVESQLSPKATTMEFHVKALEFIQSKGESILARSGDAAKMNKAKRLFGELGNALAQRTQVINQGIAARDQQMFQVAKTEIEQLKGDQTATMVLGYNHVTRMVSELNQHFTDRAVIQCLPEKEDDQQTIDKIKSL